MRTVLIRRVAMSFMKIRSKKSSLAIIPAHNEQERIGNVIGKIREVDREIDILVIDDGSTDDTATDAKKAGVRVIRLSSNMGYGVALQTGYKYAFENGYEYILQLDGDGQHDPSYIPELLRAVMTGEADLVLGSRFLEKAPRNYRAGTARKLGIRIFAFLTTRLVGLRVTDPTSGYQALNRHVVSFLARDFFPCDFPDADVILMVHRAGFGIKEVPVVMYERDSGKSMHSGLKPIYYVFKMFLSMFMTLLRKKPVLF